MGKIFSTAIEIGDTKISAAWGSSGGRLNEEESLLLLHAHGEYEIFFVSDGVLYVHAADGVYEFERGSVVVLPPAYLHYASGANCFAFVFSFEQKHASGKDAYFEKFRAVFSETGVTTFANADEYFYLLTEITESVYALGVGNEYRRKAALQLLFLRLLNAKGQTSTAQAEIQENAPYLYDIANLIARRYTERLTLKDLADSLYLSERQTSRLIKKYFHTTFPRLLNARRLDIAAAMLRGTGQSVDEIRLAVGFETESGFFTAFKKRYAVTPLQYRKIRETVDNTTKKGYN